MGCFGICPRLAIWLCRKFLGIDGNLTWFSAKRLPLLAPVVSVIPPLLFNIYFLIYELKPPQVHLQKLAAMMSGDFLGCLPIVIIDRLAICQAKQMKTQS